MAAEEVPPFSRFYMGGENDLRGYDIRSISPGYLYPHGDFADVYLHRSDDSVRQRFAARSASFTVPILTYTATLPGGDLQTSGNIEYRIPDRRPVTASLFFDGGTDGIVRAKRA